MNLIYVVMIIVMAVALGYALSGIIERFIAPLFKAKALSTQTWEQRPVDWDVSIITSLRRIWPSAEVITNVPMDAMIEGKDKMGLRRVYGKRPVDIIIIDRETRKVEGVVLISLKGEKDGLLATSQQTILEQSGYDVLLLDRQGIENLTKPRKHRQDA